MTADIQIGYINIQQNWEEDFPGISLEKNHPTPYQGEKIVVKKQALIRDLVSNMTIQERRDRQKILAMSNARLQQCPIEERRGLEITKHDVNNVLSPKKAYLFKRSSVVSTPSVNGRVPMSPPKSDSYNQEELLNGKRFLSLCGNSLFRANEVLKLVASLTLKESES